MMESFWLFAEIGSETAQMFVLMFQKSRLILVVNLTLIPDMKYKTNYIAIQLSLPMYLTYFYGLLKSLYELVSFEQCSILQYIYHLVLVLHNPRL